MRRDQPWLTERSRSLRSRSTSAEERLWSELRNRNLGGFKFIRQAPIAQFFADFLCRERMLVVEVDGATHGEDEEIASDARRSAEIESFGFRIVRVTNTDVTENMDGVLEYLLAVLERREG